MRKQIEPRKLLGWVAVSLSTLITSTWAFWGIVENFHEGWYFDSIASNLGLMLAQYLSPMLLFLGLTLVSILKPRLGAGLHAVFAVLAAVFFGAFTNTVVLLLLVPLLGIGVLYWFGDPQPRRLALSLAAGLPLLTLVVCGIGPAVRVSARLDDGDLGERRVEGNGVSLTWAPDGPGWPRSGLAWEDARQVCLRLSEDGLSIASEPQDTWRLPSVDEAVRSMARHGSNSAGSWDPQTAKASYETTPDKESPLWNVHSQVIYWWTATEVDADHAYIIVYDGKVWPRPKQFAPAYLGFRCVK